MFLHLERISGIEFCISTNMATNPGLNFSSHSNELATYSGQVVQHRKIEGFHTDSRCCYGPPQWKSGWTYTLLRNCYCGRFDVGYEEHGSDQCHYTVRQDTGTNNVVLLLKCFCVNPRLLSRSPKPGF
ncbi:hypothetical protein EB796_023738 [Bugula neritina]|uniref:Uncharacterized protein n=1 Tax=Bugula neritina TaxID=10212 RepID=A0A7J7IXN5_BUGNE|nr:hypothetical protein EB796_023738 [Bugula neritina]